MFKKNKLKFLILLTLSLSGVQEASSNTYKLIFQKNNINIPVEKTVENPENTNKTVIPGTPYSAVFNNSSIDVSLSSASIQNWTIEFWAYMNDWSESGGERKSIFTFSEDLSTRPLNIDINTGILTHYRGIAASLVMDHNVSSITGWNHIAVSQERLDSNTVKVKMYLNGNKVDESTGSYENLSQNIWFGYNGADNNKFWEGKLDNIRLWNITKTDKEIKDNYMIEASPTSSGLLGLWLINESGGGLIDSTSNNNNGTTNNVIFSENQE